MTLEELILRVNYSLRGIDDDTPAEGTDEWDYWSSLLNKKIDELYSDTTKNWNIAYDKQDLGAVDENSVSITLPTDFMSASDKALLVTADETIEIDIVKANDRSKGVFIAGFPSKLFFSVPLTKSGNLWLPGYYKPAYPSATSDIVPLPDANWGVAAVAADVAFSDITYEDKAEALQARANYLYTLMNKNNRRATYGSPRVTSYVVDRIRGVQG